MASWEDGLDKYLLAKVNAVLASGQFIEPLKEAAADEEVLDEMSAVEKALHTAGRQLINEVQPIVDRAMQKNDAKNGELPPLIKPKELALYQIAYYHFGVIKKALQSLLYARLNLPFDVKLGIRKGFKIVRSRVQKPNPVKGGQAKE